MYDTMENAWKETRLYGAARFGGRGGGIYGTRVLDGEARKRA